MLKITVDSAALARIVSHLKPSKVRRAYTRAGAEAARAMRAAAVKYIRDRKTLKAGRIRERMRLSKRGGPDISSLEWEVKASGKPVPLADYASRQTKQGVTVSVNRGSRKTIKGAFLATLKSGHRGVFVREGKARLPIRELFSSTVADTLRDTNALPVIEKRTLAVLRTAFARLVKLEMSR